MAVVLPTWPKLPPRRRTLPRYDWDSWLDGRVWALTRKDYGGDAYVFRNAAHATATRRGMRVRTGMNERGQLIIQAFGHPTKLAVPVDP